MLLPTFLPTMRVDVSSNWFKLTHPAQVDLLVATDARTRSLVCSNCDRPFKLATQIAIVPTTFAVQHAKIDQLDLMLKSRSTAVLQLPFENTAKWIRIVLGWCDGSGLELLHFDGIDVVTQGTAADRLCLWQHTSTCSGHQGDRWRTGSSGYGCRVFLAARSRAYHDPLAPLRQVTKDADTPRAYLELYLATPNGIS